jgi:transposase
VVIKLRREVLNSAGFCTSSSVEIYHKYIRIATHKRNTRPFIYTTVKEHMATTHQFMTEWTPQRFINWAATIDEDVKIYITNLLERKQHPEQAYKSCLGVLSFAKKVGKERLVKACRRAIDIDTYNYKIIQTILENGMDKLEEEKEENDLPDHTNIRGEQYYE